MASWAETEILLSGGPGSTEIHKRYTRGLVEVSEDVYAALMRALDSDTRQPCLAPDIEVARFTSRRHGTHAVIHNPRSHKYVRITGEEAAMATLFDGTCSVRELTNIHAPATDIHPAFISDLVSFLHREGFLTTPWIDTYALLKERIAGQSQTFLRRAWRWMRTATIPLPGAPRFVNAIYASGGRMMFSPLVYIPLAVFLLCGAVAFAYELSGARYAMAGRPTATAATALILLGLVATFLHELAHALATRHAGRRVLFAGFQLYFANPAFFVDSSDMVMSGRRKRVVNAIAGLYADAVIAGVAALGAAALSETTTGEILFRFAGLTYVLIAINLVPFIELDGYWLLTDVLDLPDLRPRALAFVRNELPGRVKARSPLTRGEWGLTLFGFAGVASAAFALILAWTFWSPIIRAFVSGAWRLGFAGQALLVILGVLVLGPLSHALTTTVGEVKPRIHAWLSAFRFRIERRWRVEAGEIIARLPGAADLALEDLNDLAGRVQRRKFRRNETIVYQKRDPDFFYLIRRGQCAVIEEAAGGNENVISQLDSGATFGERALIDGIPSGVAVRGTRSGELFAIDAGAFKRHLARNLKISSTYARPTTSVRTLRPFRHLEPAAAEALTRSGAWVRCFPGDTVLPQGTIDGACYVVARGQLQTERDGRAVGTLCAGNFFGEISLLHCSPQPVTVRALTPVVLFVISKVIFDEVVRASLQTADLPEVVLP